MHLMNQNNKGRNIACFEKTIDMYLLSFCTDLFNDWRDSVHKLTNHNNQSKVGCKTKNKPKISIFEKQNEGSRFQIFFFLLFCLMVEKVVIINKPSLNK